MPLNFTDDTINANHLIVEPALLFGTVFEYSTLEKVLKEGDKKHPFTRQKFTSIDIVMDESFIEDFKKQRKLYLQLKEESKSNHTNGQILWQAFFMEEPYLLPQNKNNNGDEDLNSELARMEILLDSGVDINDPINEKQDTALLNSIQSNNIELVNFLLGKNAELKIECILWAKILNYSDIETILINHHNKNSSDKLDNKILAKEISDKYLNNTFDILSTILSDAAEKKHLELIQYYLSTSPFNNLILLDNSQMNNARLNILAVLSKIPEENRGSTYKFILHSILPKISLASVLQKNDIELLINVLSFFSNEEREKNYYEILTELKKTSTSQNTFRKNINYFLPLLHNQFNISFLKIYGQTENAISLVQLFAYHGFATTCISLIEKNPNNEVLLAQLFKGLSDQPSWQESHFYLFNELCDQTTFFNDYTESLSTQFQVNVIYLKIYSLFLENQPLNDDHKKTLRLLPKLGFPPDETKHIKNSENLQNLPSILELMVFYNFPTEDLENALAKVKKENYLSSCIQILNKLFTKHEEKYYILSICNWLLAKNILPEENISSIVIMLTAHGFFDKICELFESYPKEKQTLFYTNILTALSVSYFGMFRLNKFHIKFLTWLLKERGISPIENFNSDLGPNSILFVLTEHGLFNEMKNVLNQLDKTQLDVGYEIILDRLYYINFEKKHLEILNWLLRNISPTRRYADISLLKLMAHQGITTHLNKIIQNLSLTEVYDELLAGLIEAIKNKNEFEIETNIFEQHVPIIQLLLSADVQHTVKTLHLIIQNGDNNLKWILENILKSELSTSVDIKKITKNLNQWIDTLSPQKKPIAYKELLASLNGIKDFNPEVQVNVLEKYFPIIELLLSSDEQNAIATLHFIIQTKDSYLKWILDHIVESELSTSCHIKTSISKVINEVRFYNISSDQIKNLIKVEHSNVDVTSLSQNKESIKLLTETLDLLNKQSGQKREILEVAQHPSSLYGSQHKKPKTDGEFTNPLSLKK